MVGAVRHFTLQPMAHTNHKFPEYVGPGVQKEAKSTVAGTFLITLGLDPVYNNIL